MERERFFYVLATYVTVSPFRRVFCSCAGNVVSISLLERLRTYVSTDFRRHVREFFGTISWLDRDSLPWCSLWRGVVFRWAVFRGAVFSKSWPTTTTPPPPTTTMTTTTTTTTTAITITTTRTTTATTTTTTTTTATAITTTRARRRQKDKKQKQVSEQIERFERSRSLFLFGSQKAP